ncbi:MAG: LacI family DNA-binding transcriptional regulator [Bacillota bacterium]
MSPTLLDIAKETRTSVSTVSRVLAGGGSAARISEATRARVLEAARRLGYRPNLVARSLRTRRSHTVALLVSDIANPWFGQLASLIEQSLHRHDYSLMLCNSGEDPELELEYLRLLPGKGIDGLILVPVLNTKKPLEDLLPANLPLVIFDRPISDVATCVSSDQDQAAEVLCSSLEQAGVKSVAIICGPQHVVTHRRRCELIASHFQVLACHEGPAQRETGRQAYVKFEGVQPDAIVCTNNFLGQGVLEALENTESLAILACFDEIPMMDLLPVPIVCGVQDVPALAEGCVQLLLPQLRGEDRKLEPLVLPTRVATNRAFQSMLIEHTTAVGGS